MHDRGGFLRALAALVLKLPATLAGIARDLPAARAHVALIVLGVQGLAGTADGRFVGAVDARPA